MEFDKTKWFMAGGGPRISGNLEVGWIYELVGSGGMWGDGHLGWGPGVMEVKGM